MCDWMVDLGIEEETNGEEADIMDTNCAEENVMRVGPEKESKSNRRRQVFIVVCVVSVYFLSRRL